MLPDAAGIPVTAPDLHTLASATTELAVTLDRAARAALAADRALEGVAVATAAQLVLRAAALLSRTQAHLDPAGAATERAALAAFLERELPELFAPASSHPGPIGRWLVHEAGEHEGAVVLAHSEADALAGGADVLGVPADRLEATPEAP